MNLKRTKLRRLPLLMTQLIAGVLCSITIHGQIITTIAGGTYGHGGYWGDGGLATAAEFNVTSGLVVDACNNIYIGDGNNSRIRKVDAVTGIITTIAGTGVPGYSGDGGPASAALLQCSYMTLDNSGNLLVCEYYKNTIRKIDMTTGIISRIIGDGSGSIVPSGDGGPATAATIFGGDVACDRFGNIYIGDLRTIRKVDPAGIITTVAGTGLPGFTGEGVPATATNISIPIGLCTDTKGNFYFVDSTNSVRKVTVSTGLITRVAGTGDGMSMPYTGDGIPATACRVGTFDLSIDDTGNLYLADYANHRIEKVDTFGIIRTIACTGVPGYSGDGGPAMLAQIQYPKNVVIDANVNNMYIIEISTLSRRVRKVEFLPARLTVPTVALSGTTIYPTGATVTVTATVANAGPSYLVRWLNHGVVFATTTTPLVTYTKGPGLDTITARVVPTSCGYYDSTTSAGHVVMTEEGLASPWPSPKEREVLRVFPNPVGSVMYVNGLQGTATYRVMDLLGRVMLEGAVDAVNNSIPVNGFAKGVYVLEALDAATGVRMVSKVVKE